MNCEEDHHNISYTPVDAVRSHPYSARSHNLQTTHGLQNIEFTELYNIFVNKVDQLFFEDFDLFMQISLTVSGV